MRPVFSPRIFLRWSSAYPRLSSASISAGIFETPAPHPVKVAPDAHVIDPRDPHGVVDLIGHVLYSRDDFRWLAKKFPHIVSRVIVERLLREQRGHRRLFRPRRPLGPRPANRILF
jgi:hypothetical protein